MPFLTQAHQIPAHTNTRTPRRICRGVTLCAVLCATGATLPLSAWANDLPTGPDYQSARPATEAVGIAAYASYTNQGYANAEAANLERVLGQSVEIHDVVVNGVNYLRLQSAAQDAATARALVNQAQQAGYSSWFVTSNADKAAVMATQKAPAPATATEPAAATQAETATVLDSSSAPAQLLLTPDNPELALQLPEGPLLGELFPPRSPLPPK